MALKYSRIWFSPSDTEIAYDLGGDVAKAVVVWRSSNEIFATDESRDHRKQSVGSSDFTNSGCTAAFDGNNLATSEQRSVRYHDCVAAEIDSGDTLVSKLTVGAPTANSIPISWTGTPSQALYRAEIWGGSDLFVLQYNNTDLSNAIISISAGFQLDFAYLYGSGWRNTPAVGVFTNEGPMGLGFVARGLPQVPQYGFDGGSRDGQAAGTIMRSVLSSLSWCFASIRNSATAQSNLAVLDFGGTSTPIQFHHPTEGANRSGTWCGLLMNFNGVGYAGQPATQLPTDGSTITLAGSSGYEYLVTAAISETANARRTGQTGYGSFQMGWASPDWQETLSWRVQQGANPTHIAERLNIVEAFHLQDPADGSQLASGVASVGSGDVTLDMGANGNATRAARYWAVAVNAQYFAPPPSQPVPTITSMSPVTIADGRADQVLVGTDLEGAQLRIGGVVQTIISNTGTQIDYVCETSGLTKGAVDAVVETPGGISGTYALTYVDNLPSSGALASEDVSVTLGRAADHSYNLTDDDLVRTVLTKKALQEATNFPNDYYENVSPPPVPPADQVGTITPAVTLACP